MCSALDCGADCINEALIGLTTTVAIATKPHQSHNVAYSLMMFLILLHDLVYNFRIKSQIQSTLWLFL